MYFRTAAHRWPTGVRKKVASLLGRLEMASISGQANPAAASSSSSRQSSASAQSVATD